MTPNAQTNCPRQPLKVKKAVRERSLIIRLLFLLLLFLLFTIFYNKTFVSVIVSLLEHRKMREILEEEKVEPNAMVIRRLEWFGQVNLCKTRYSAQGDGCER